jgi:hypothetical protein
VATFESLVCYRRNATRIGKRCPEKGQKKCPIWLIGQTSEAKEEGCETVVCKHPHFLSTIFFEVFLETPELHLEI